MASNIAYVQSDDRNQNQSQSNLLTTLNNLLRNNPIFSGTLLTNDSVRKGSTVSANGISLAAGDNTINHGLGRALVGYLVTHSTAASTFYDKQLTNTTPQLTLVINSSVATVVNIYVF